jgi:hypothetical protein
MMLLRTTKWESLQVLLGCTAVGILIFLATKDVGMFWDNVLFASKMGNHLYEHGILSWNIPDTFDPGHPPFLGFVLAIFWKLFGHSLWVSHLAMLPFVIGTLYQLYRCAFYYTQNQAHSFFALLLLLADPTLATSLVLVNPEVIVLFFFFLGLNGFLYKKSLWKFVGLFFLSIITFRSMMLFAGFFIFDILNHLYINKKSFKQLISLKFITFYCLAALPALLYVSWRLIAKGWLQTHEDSPWASLWHLPSLQEFFKNGGVLIWRYLDFGRIFVFLFLIVGGWSLKRHKKINVSVRQLLLLAFASVFCIVIAVLFSTNAFGHRYFIVSYISFILMAFLILQQLKNKKRIVYSFLLIALFTGNFWIYPEKVSQGWDATLAHIPYHSLRTKAINFLDQEHIDFKEVGTFFPNYNTQDQIDLNGDQRALSHFNKKNPFVFYSNVYNLSDEDLDFIQKNYTEIKRFTSFQIYISILKRKKNEHLALF